MFITNTTKYLQIIPPMNYPLSIFEKIYKSQINIATLQQMQTWYILQLINILNASIMVQDDFQYLLNQQQIRAHFVFNK